MSAIATMVNRINVQMPFFGVVYFWANWYGASACFRPAVVRVASCGPCFRCVLLRFSWCDARVFIAMFLLGAIIIAIRKPPSNVDSDSSGREELHSEDDV